ncbi:methyl-accepting chemotaxis protein [Thermohalobacter berrensis]|uniref:Chemotaxis protein n=1 Tax=Thermohalobacter berrensis TaxID=99594 RepID=A0A419SUD3_9FIRM|nr:methyl-accepting chemotaxis protein [Thermohalobacter berrensis]RKD28850.1 hypothetical protein BET03_07410 [Thermohalobacter berrensis]
MKFKIKPKIKFNFKLQGKLLVKIISVLILFSVIIVYQVDKEVTKLITDNKIKSVVNLGYSLLDEKYPGEWKVKGDKLYKGKKIMNTESFVIYKIKKQTESVTAIFLKDNIICSNIIDNNGYRVVNIKAPKDIANHVLKEGKEYIGETRYGDKSYYGKHVPIKDKDGRIIGMWFSGVEKAVIKEQVKGLVYKIGIITLLIIVISIIISTVVIRKITREISKVVSTLNEVEKGNFNVKCDVKSNDEVNLISKSLNNMISNVKYLIKEVKNSVNLVSNSAKSLAEITGQSTQATNEVSKTIEEIAGTANYQAGETEKGASKTKELAHKIQEVSNYIKDIISKFDSANRLSDKGLEVVEILGDRAERTKKASIEVNEVISDVDSSSKEIGGIIDTIDEIAEQTSLLALNASIEAARAGEAGRGFAVVADEIRKLAEQSVRATDKIRNIIEKIQKNSTRLVSTMDSAKVVMVEQEEAVSNTEIIFKDISDTIESLNKQIKEIEVLNSEMVNKKDEIVGIIENISASAEETAAATQQVSASAEEQLAAVEEIDSYSKELKDLSQKLQNEVDKFTV